MAIVAPAVLPSVKRISLPPTPIQASFKAPKIVIGADIPLIAQRFAWSLVPGPAPFRVMYQFNSGPLFDRLMALKNPTYIRVEADGEIGGKAAPFNATIGNVWINQPIKIDAFHWGVEMADLRVRWQGRKFTWTANRTWLANDFGGISLDGVSANDPGRLRAQFDRFEKFRYLSWSKNPATDRPWTALELLVQCLSGLYGGDKIGSIPPDNGVIQENLVWKEEPVEQVISELCSLARVQVGVTLVGDVHIYAMEEVIDPASVMPTKRPPINGGVLYMQDLKRIRPKRVDVRFEKKIEVVAISIDGTTTPAVDPNNEFPIIGSDRAANGTSCPQIDSSSYRPGNFRPGGTPAVACFNVVKATRDFTYSGVNYKRGQYVSMAVMLAYMGFTDEEFRSKYLNQIFIMEYAVLRNPNQSGKPDLARMQEAAAVKQAYNRLYQLDPYWVRRWESWETTRAALYDPVTRFALPSAIWKDICFIPATLLPKHAQYLPDWRFRVHNYLVSEDDPERTSAITVAAARVESQQLGVFYIDFPHDPDQVIDEFLPSAVDNPPEVSAAGAPILWCDPKTKLARRHTMEVMISIVPALAEPGTEVGTSVQLPSDKRFFTVSTPEEEGAEGEPVEWFSHDDFARYPNRQGLGTENLTSVAAFQAAEAGYPSNIGVLIGVAQGQANIVMNSFRDRYAGYVVWPGADISKLRLFGPCRAITIEFTPQTGLRSYYDLTEPLPIPQLTSLLTPAQRRIVYGQLNPTD